ncbi:MAG: DUF2304 domain-containing protein [Collinsella sp.]|nr:DUF2304 domain-containing protein [Collinsella sp.]
MTFVTQVLAAIFAVLFFVYVIRLVSKGNLSLRYSLFWLALSVAILIAAIFPGFIGAIGEFFGFVLSTNFVFFLGLFLLLAFSLMLSVVATKQAVSIKNLTQRLAIVEKEVRQSGNR